MPAFRMTALVAVLACAVCAEATEFLGAQRKGHNVAKDVVEQMLLLELPSSSNRVRLEALKAELQPTFSALPKNIDGQLEPSTVRYALHRYFVQKHGWFVKGLDPEGGGWNSSTTTATGEVMKSLAPMYIQELFVQRSHGSGLGLEELAVFAATVSDLVFQESLGELREVYDKLDLSDSRLLPKEDFFLATRAFLADLVTGEYTEFTSQLDFPRMEADARELYPEYDDTVMWSKDLFYTQEFNNVHRRNPFITSQGVSFDRAADFLRDYVDNFGKLFEGECRTLKEDLVGMEQSSTGRMLLSDFYRNDKLQLHENVDYLRNMGALENEETTPRLIIPNYINSPSRCMPLSSYFSVCCPDECEGLLGRLERDIGKPTATPTEIIELVTHLPSDTVEVPRNLSTLMTSRLDDVAALHNGRIPLHGRLFMQWMHHAYPRECPYPHEAGTTKPVSQDEWLAQNEHLEDVLASPQERARHSILDATSSIGPEELPWTAVEELVSRHVKKTQAHSKIPSLRVVVCLVAVVSFALPMFRIQSVLSGKTMDKSSHMV